jgi:hypothetical protein
MSDDRTMPQDGDEIEVTEAMSEAGAQVISDWMNQDREISRALSIEVFRQMRATEIWQQKEDLSDRYKVAIQNAMKRLP